MSNAEPPSGGNEAMITALRFVLVALGQATGTFTWDASFTLNHPELGALAGLVIGARCALAAHDGVDDPAGRLEWARRGLESELEIQELNAALTGQPEATPQIPAAELMPGCDLDLKDGAALWEFIAAARAGPAKRSRRDHEFACFLAAAWGDAVARMHVAAEGIPLDQARAKVAEFVETRRAIYGSLATGR